MPRRSCRRRPAPMQALAEQRELLPLRRTASAGRASRSDSAVQALRLRVERLPCTALARATLQRRRAIRGTSLRAAPPARPRRSASARAGRPPGRPASRRSRGRRRRPPASAQAAIGAHHALVVEGPQVFERAAAAAQRAACRPRHARAASGQRLRTARPVPRRPAPGSGRRSPATCGARRASAVSTSCSAAAPSEVTTPMRRGNGAQRPLARGIEQALRLEPRLQPQELLVQRAGAGALHRLRRPTAIRRAARTPPGGRAARPAGRRPARSRAGWRRGGTSRSAAAPLPPSASFRLK